MPLLFLHKKKKKAFKINKISLSRTNGNHSEFGEFELGDPRDLGRFEQTTRQHHTATTSVYVLVSLSSCSISTSIDFRYELTIHMILDIIITSINYFNIFFHFLKNH